MSGAFLNQRYQRIFGPWFRPTAWLLILATCVALGWWSGPSLGRPVILALVVVVVSAFGLSLAEMLNGHQLLDWLRASDSEGPQLPMLWGQTVRSLDRLRRQHARDLAEERLRQEQFLSGIQASPNGLILLDSVGRITWMSTVAAEHFGLDSSRDMGQFVTNLVRQPAFVQHLQAGDYGAPLKCPMPGHGYLSIQVRRYGDGLKLVLSQDITERETTDKMRRDFVSNVSHEIRTPLTVLHGFIETLGALPLTDIERRRVITLMGQQTERMKALVSDLLVLAKLEGSPRPSVEEWIKVSSLMVRLQSEGMGLSQGRHPMTFICDGKSELAEIAVVESEWFSAMSNLVSNAVRYTPEGGAIDVRWSLLPDGSGEFSVKDQGIGVNAKHIPRLTERFYRIDGSRSRETGGTGLGLSIVKHVVQRHGGELRIKSEPGKGSTFSLSVPTARLR